MCFSAEASFTAAAVLTVIGIGLMMIRKPNRLRYLSMVPFLFALQQASEGTLWLLLPNEPHSLLTSIFTLSFLFFAFIVWPIWIPFSLFVAEKIKSRKIIIGCIFLAGILFGLYSLTYLYGNEVRAEIVGRSISYYLVNPFQVNLWLLKGVYGLIVLIPCFISSLEYIKGYGYLIIASWTFTALFFLATFSSTWCFFSAILSLYLVFVVLKNRGGEV